MVSTFCAAYVQTSSSKQGSENRHSLLPHPVLPITICAWRSILFINLLEPEFYI